MAKKADDTVLDGLLDIIINNMTALHVNTAEPANRAAAISDSLATSALTSGDGTKANGDTSGRKVTLAQKADLAISPGGTATHISVISATILLYVTTCTSQLLNGGGTVTVPAWDVEVADPA